MTAPAGQTLEALVRDELRGPVSELVRRLIPELVAETLNGSSATPLEHAAEAPSGPRVRTRPQSEGSGTSAKVCRVCGETKPLDAYEAGRGTCRSCRRDQARAREGHAHAHDDEEPHPAPTPERGRRGQRRLDRDHVWNERRRALIEDARANGVTTELRGGRTFTVLHLAPQFELPAPSP